MARHGDESSVRSDLHIIAHCHRPIVFFVENSFEIKDINEEMEPESVYVSEICQNRQIFFCLSRDSRAFQQVKPEELD